MVGESDDKMKKTPGILTKKPGNTNRFKLRFSKSWEIGRSDLYYPKFPKFLGG